MPDNENHSPDGQSPSQEDLETLFKETFAEEPAKGTKNTQKDSPDTPLFEGSFSQDFRPSKKTTQNEASLLDSELEKTATAAGDRRSKTSLRLKYEAEVNVIKKTTGNLEDIRRKLKLSKRKISQLLFVDPSAWTRWTSGEGDAPPHIYRALQWYLIVQEKHPGLTSSVWLNSVAQPQLSRHEIDNIKTTIQQEMISEGEQGFSTRSDLSEVKKQLKYLQHNQSHKLEGLARYLVYAVIAQTLAIIGLILFTAS